VLASKQEYAPEASRFKAQGWTAYKRCTLINDPGLRAAIDFDLIERRTVAVQR
jgi:hypothetical protein